MPLRGIIFPPEALQFGFASRLYVYTYMRAITQLQNDGLSLHQIVSEFNRQGGGLRKTDLGMYTV
jgi:hypothetical protein